MGSYHRRGGEPSLGYDNANRLSSVTDWNSRAVAYAYDDAGRMTTATLPSSTGIVSTYSYDNADRLTGISHVQNGSTTIASVAYTLDAVGNRTQRVDQQGTHTYAYDNLYRLTSVTYPGPTTTSYAFDAFGNRTSMTDGTGTTSYAYDDAERLTSVTPPTPQPAVSYTWDNNGDLTQRGSDTFTWDYEDRMVGATVGGMSTAFGYRGDGLRDSRTTGGVTTGFTWDVNRGLPVVLDDGNQYLYGAGLASMVAGSGTYYYLADGLGSTMAIVDTSGTVQKSYTYDAYGKPTATGTLANEFDFAGQQTDPTGLQYLRARYMDPATGRFISREPLASGPGWTGNPQGYGSGNPARLTDPSGDYPVDGNGCRVDERADPYCSGDEPYGSMHQATPAASGCEPGGRFYPECEHYQPPYSCDAHMQTVTGTCAVVRPGKRGGDLSQLVGEYLKNIVAGCQEDPALCAATIGTQAATALLSAVVSTAVAGACADTGGLVCFILVPASGTLHYITFKAINDHLRQQLIEEGKRARKAEGQ